MARTALGTAVRATPAGVIPSDNDAAINTTDGNFFPWKEGRVIVFLNGDDASVTPTFLTQGTVGAQGLAIADLPGSATPAAGLQIYGPFGPEFRRDDGNVWVDWAGTTPAAVTAMVLDVG